MTYTTVAVLYVDSQKIYKIKGIKFVIGDNMGKQTVLTKAAPKSNSLRTTVPIFIVQQFNLSEGDILEWELQIVNGELLIVVHPIKNRSD